MITNYCGMFISPGESPPSHTYAYHIYIYANQLTHIYAKQLTHPEILSFAEKLLHEPKQNVGVERPFMCLVKYQHGVLFQEWVGHRFSKHNPIRHIFDAGLLARLVFKPDAIAHLVISNNTCWITHDWRTVSDYDWRMMWLQYSPSCPVAHPSLSRHASQ